MREMASKDMSLLVFFDTKKQLPPRHKKTFFNFAAH